MTPTVELPRTCDAGVCRTQSIGQRTRPGTEDRCVRRDSTRRATSVAGAAPENNAGSASTAVDASRSSVLGRCVGRLRGSLVSLMTAGLSAVIKIAEAGGNVDRSAHAVGPRGDLQPQERPQSMQRSATTTPTAGEQWSKHTPLRPHVRFVGQGLDSPVTICSNIPVLVDREGLEPPTPAL